VRAYGPIAAQLNVVVAQCSQPEHLQVKITVCLEAKTAIYRTAPCCDCGCYFSYKGVAVLLSSGSENIQPTKSNSNFHQIFVYKYQNLQNVHSLQKIVRRRLLNYCYFNNCYLPGSTSYVPYSWRYASFVFHFLNEWRKMKCSSWHQLSLNKKQGDSQHSFCSA